MTQTIKLTEQNSIDGVGDVDMVLEEYTSEYMQDMVDDYFRNSDFAERFENYVYDASVAFLQEAVVNAIAIQLREEQSDDDEKLVDYNAVRMCVDESSEYEHLTDICHRKVHEAINRLGGKITPYNETETLAQSSFRLAIDSAIVMFENTIIDIVYDFVEQNAREIMETSREFEIVDKVWD